ncbi:MAG: heat-inducible transcription repressor HrcA [Deltaproteobacteria bacterium]|nr:heat-inducible transcription repressor HrcA [Deltaproteobacteria bacterium]
MTEYIATGEPVGSRRLAKRYGINLSPATIRNVLSDLEDAGYLQQPHTSAGRVPTDAGFRVFIDALVQMREVPDTDKTLILARLRDLRPGQDDVMREAGKLLASMTDAAAVLTAPRPDQEHLDQLHFMPLRAGRLLAVMVTRSGAIQNRVVPYPEVERAELDRLNNLLDELVPGATLLELRDRLSVEMETERGRYDSLRRSASKMVEAIPDATTATEVVIEGQGKLFERPEFGDVGKIRTYMRAFEERERILELIEQTVGSAGVQVLVGTEASLGDITDVSVITSHYGEGSSPGTLGVIGPARMDYAKVVPLVDFTARVVGELYTAADDPDDERR